MRCARCNGKVISEKDQDGTTYVCLMCGDRPRITPLEEYYARQLRPTERLWPQRTGHKVPPPTRVFE